MTSKTTSHQQPLQTEDIDARLTTFVYGNLNCYQLLPTKLI